MAQIETQSHVHNVADGARGSLRKGDISSSSSAAHRGCDGNITVANSRNITTAQPPITSEIQAAADHCRPNKAHQLPRSLRQSLLMSAVVLVAPGNIWLVRFGQQFCGRRHQLNISAATIPVQLNCSTLAHCRPYSFRWIAR